MPSEQSGQCPNDAGRDNQGLGYLKTVDTINPKKL